MIRVMVVDDSSAVRSALTRALDEDPGIEVVGAAADSLEAWERLADLRPHVMTLDIEMPGMDGLTFLDRLMHAHPMPVIIVSSLARRSQQIVVDALASGAVNVIQKPHATYPMEQMLRDLKEAVKQAADARPRAQEAPAEAAPAIPPARAKQTMIAVGSSTGGTAAFETFARGLPHGHPGVVLSQHLPPDFVPRFAERLSTTLSSKVVVARGGEEVRPGTIHISPATHHLKVKRDGLRWVTELMDAPALRFHRPNIDVLLASVALAAGPAAVGVILTGMGTDGAEGLLAMRRAGAFTLAQDEATSVVYGMPRAAKENGGAVEQQPLEKLARRAIQMLVAARPIAAK